MSVQRIEFADHGQDFLWWEIQVETGRVVGCGPFQAGVWASGRISVDMATIAVGKKPRIFSDGTGPKGRTMLYAIAAIKPAPRSGGGGGVASMTDLPALVATVRALQDAGDWSYPAGHQTGQRIVLELERMGARIVDGREPMTMMFAGVRASSTGGYPGLFNNWISAAERRLAQKEAQ